MADRTNGMDGQEEFWRGVEEFNAEKFFDAHESWEAIWLKAPEPDKTFLQGITQITAAFHHYSRDNRSGAESLLRRGLEKLDGFPVDYRGVQLEALRLELRAWAAALKNAQYKPPQKKPRIKRSR